MVFIEGLLIGLGMIIFIGPVFFLLLNSTLQFGTNAGVLVALGIIVSDVACVLLCYYGFSSFVIIEQNRFWIGIIGSVILFGLGVNYLLKKVEISSSISIPTKGVFSFFMKGFSVNFFNPFVFVVWIGVFNYGQQRYTAQYSFLVFIGAVLIGILITDIIKVLIAKKIQKFISSERLTVFFKITGVVLVLFSIRLLFLVW